MWCEARQRYDYSGHGLIPFAFEDNWLDYVRNFTPGSLNHLELLLGYRPKAVIRPTDWVLEFWCRSAADFAIIKLYIVG